MSKRPYTRRNQSQWQQHIHKQTQSGLSIAAYCQHHQLTPSNFYYWRAKLNTGSSDSITGSTDNPWLSVTNISDATASPSHSIASNHTITLSLPGGITLSIEGL